MSPFGRVVTAVTVVHLAVGLWVATSVPGPLLSADDVTYLSLGRALAGEGSTPIGAQPPYGLLYPMLLAPGWLVGFEESAMLTWARVLNAALGAALVPVLYLLVRRLLAIDRAESLVAATIGAALPAGFLTASIVWTERLLPLLVAGTLLALTMVWRDRTAAAAFATAALAMALVTAHPRMAAPAALVVMALATLLWVDHQRRRARLVVVAAAVGVVIAELARRVVHDHAFGGDASYFVGDLAERRGLSQVPNMVVHGIGTLGYLVAATAGLATVGVILLWRTRPVGPVALGVLSAVVVTAAWFLLGVDRADAWFHGRYVEVLAPVLVAVGVVGLRRLGRWTVVAALCAGPVIAGILGAWAGPGATWSRPRSPVMMLGVEISGAPFGGDVFEPGASASVALIAGLLLFALVRSGLPVVAVALAVTLAGLGVASGRDGLDQLYETATAGVVERALDGIEIAELAVEPSTLQPNTLAAVAWEVGLDHTIDRIGSATTHVLLPAAAVPPPGAVLVAELPDASLWALD